MEEQKRKKRWVDKLKEAFRGEEAEDMGIGWFSQESTVGQPSSDTRIGNSIGSGLGLGLGLGLID